MSHIESNCGEFATVKTLEFGGFKKREGANP
jgi:hypothetical protein